MKLKDISNEELLDILKDYEIQYKDILSGLDIPFGCEIEFEATPHQFVYKGLYNIKKYSSNMSKWKLVSDESLNDLKGNIRFTNNIYGGEIVSPILHNTKDDWVRLKEVCTMLKNLQAKNTDYSSAQIHFDNELFKDNYKGIINLLKIWAIYEDIIYRFSKGNHDHLRKKINEFARPMSRKYISIIKSKYINDYDILIKNLKFIRRMTGLSFSEFYTPNKDSFEVRTPNGIVDEVIWQNNINFFKHILSSALDENKDWELLDCYVNDYNRNYYKLKNYEKLNIDKAKRLGDFIFDEEEDKMNFMKQYVK